MVVILPVLARVPEGVGPSCEEASCHSLLLYNLELLRRGGTAVVPICTGRNDGEGSLSLESTKTTSKKHDLSKHILFTRNLTVLCI